LSKNICTAAASEWLMVGWLDVLNPSMKLFCYVSETDTNL